MITVHVKYCAQARQAAGISDEKIALKAACSIGELLVQLSRKNDGLRAILLDEKNRPHLSLLLFVNGEQTAGNSPLPLKNDDVIEILPPMSGG